ncbi:hypothetical protein [Sphingobacterium paucimobilis]|uniref:Uncharacterized protein n=1 Tax=Sphingobacterium paucimobilis HER1398 TaxID=1346330 RepID=U2HCF9_9SPHI|nr:hypothetical protein [Sphingobacterium paucimobilis]ERJ59436.1 hypothetical protein M472_11685 [Sphingobacterium paucimobilis HER1398]
MKHIITFLFIVSLLVVGFVSLNYMWNWVVVDYTQLVKVAISIFVVIFIATGLAMVFSAAYARPKNQSDVGKKD